MAPARRNQRPKPSKPEGARRGRPPSIDTEALLEVARDVFLEKGIRATTHEVAERAGISEGAVFHRFKSKEALFQAAMNFDPHDAPRFFADTLHTLEGLEVREALVRLATTMVEVGRVALPLMMMSWSNPDFMSSAQCDRKARHFLHMLKAFSAYFERRMEKGELRRMDAEIVTRVFIGAVHHYGMTRVFAPDMNTVPEGMFVRGLVDLLLQGALPGLGASSTRERPLQNAGSRRGLRAHPVSASQSRVR